MKRSITLFLIIFHITCLAQEKPKVLATASMIWDMAKNIGGEHLDIQCIVPIGGDPHLYDPTPKDVKSVANAQLILKNGLTFEGWFNELIENSGTKAKSVIVTEGIQPVQSLTYENATDPHAWMNVTNAYTYIENIKKAFIELLPEKTAFFEKNYQNYLQELKKLDAYILKKIQSIPEEKRVLITSHDAFQYYGRRYGIQLEAILGVSTDADVQTSDINRLNKVIKERKVPAVFIESTINPKLLKQLARDNNIAVGGELYADSIGDKESDASTYIDMLKHNTDTIVKGLSAEVKTEQESNEKKDSSGHNIWLYGLIGLLFIGGFIFVVKKLDNA